MANSVVKVTDIPSDNPEDGLILLVGLDGTITPDKETVQAYLNSKTGSTNIKIMHINKTDAKGVDFSVDDLTYVPDADADEEEVVKEPMDEVARNLHNFKLDHDYTPLTSPLHSPPHEEVDEISKTLSILDGGGVLDPQPPQLIPEISVVKVQTTPKLTAKVIKTTPALITIPKPTIVPHKPTQETTPKVNTAVTTTPEVLTPKAKAKIITTQAKTITPKLKPVVKPRVVIVEAGDVDDEEDEDFDMDFECEDDENDSDFEPEEAKARTLKRTSKRTKSESKISPPKTVPKTKQLKEEPAKPPEAPKQEQKPDTPTKVVEKPPEIPVEVKKPPKKEKKPPKPIPDDFALFSTPDIIRRVGGKEPTTPTTPGGESPGSPTKPAKISQENRSKSATEQSPTAMKHNRLSLDNKVPSLDNKVQKIENKSKDRRISTDAKAKRTSIDEKPKVEAPKKTEVSVKTTPKALAETLVGLEALASTSAADLSPITLNSTNTLPIAESDFTGDVSQSIDQSNIHLDAAGLDLDQSLLDNINNDMISEDILYQVAQSLVSNTELQNAIEKGINDGNLVLDPSMQPISLEQSLEPAASDLEEQNTSSTLLDTSQKGTQIVRPDGRIVVIPPIERPTTRSRNKKKDDEKVLPILKSIHKPLDDEHVSGNELDSSNEEEEESEDDPNKLWCICNQPHNNRFMICCDTCEEWYHGKCVNITKTMGQQMESEGKEWICRFCKDPSLRRPQAAARRVRKASRNSRASTDSAGSSQKNESGLVPCVVCQKPARKNSIFCSETCILAHAQGVERVVVFERATGHMLTGNKAPSASNLDQWLKEHPGYEVVRSAGKIVTSKAHSMTQSKLKLVKNSDNEGVSIAVQKKGISLGVLKHSPKHPQQPGKSPLKPQVAFKIISKQINTKEPKAKLIQAQPLPVQQPKFSPATASTAPRVKVIQTTLTKINKVTPIIAKEKSPVVKPKVKQIEQQSYTPKPNPHENIRENVQKTLHEQLTNRLKHVEDLKLNEDEVKSISTEIESQLYKCFGDTGQKYRNKYRSLIFNIKDVKNQTLWRRICEKSINPYELVRLSPDDLASQELAMWREREAKHQLDMIKKSELELLNCNRQYVLKTHKGEEVLEDNRPKDNIDNTEAIKSLTEGSILDASDIKLDSKDSDKKPTSSLKHSHKDRERKSSRDKSEKDYRSHRSSSRDKDRDRSRKRSRSKDRTKHSDKKRSRSRDRDRHRKSSHKSSRHKKDLHISTTDKLDKKSKEILEQLVDNKIVPPLEDRLWKHVPQDDIVAPVVAESDSDHEPTSTVTIPTPPRNSDQDDGNQSSSESKNDKEKEVVEERSTSPPPKTPPEEIWRGTINMIDVAQISITAHEVSGECRGLGKELPGNLDIVGRISPDTVWDYIGKMKCSNSKIISLLRLNATNVEEKMPYLALYSYLSSRNRLGVVKSTNKAVKDFYILPLASQKPIPQALLPLNGPGFEESRPALLLGIIVRDKRKRPYLDNTVQVTVKRTKVETPPPASTAPPRSYTPPPIKDPRLNKLPLPPTVPAVKDDDEEPYSPEDSDPDSIPTPLDDEDESESTSTTIFADAIVPPPYSATEPLIPGLGTPPLLPSNTLEIQRQMEELNKKIEMQKSEINSISQNIASTEIGTSALANIALPSNLQQILDSIKTIGAVNPTEPETKTTELSPSVENSQTDLTIPLMIPKSFSRPLSNTPTSKLNVTSDTIPLNLPTKPKLKQASVNSPSRDVDKPSSTSSVLSSLSEEDLIRKAAEMLGETENSKSSSKRKSMDVKGSSASTPPPPPPVAKRTKLDVDLPPVPGLD